MSYLSQNIGAEEWASFVLDGLHRESVLLASGAHRIVTSARQIHVPRAAAVSPQWLGELEEIDPDGTAPDEVVLTPKKIGALQVASNEAVGDASVALLDSVGQIAVRSVSLAADNGLFAGPGTGNAPLGILNRPGTQKNTALDPTYVGLVTAAGTIRAAGGKPDVAYVNPADHTALVLAADGLNRPLLQATDAGPVEVIGGMRLWPTAAVPAGQAVVAQADQILVAVRDDPRVDISTDALFASDGVVVRTIARLDVGIADEDGVLVIGGAA